MMKWLYNLMYRYSFISIPWDIGPRAELVRLVESGRIKPCRAIDLGSGTASNVIYLAQHGFDVTGVDYTAAAIDLGRERARQAGVKVEFIQDDLTNLQHTGGVYDLLVDYGTLDDIAPSRRHLFVENILPLTHPDTTFVLYCFEWATRWWVPMVENRIGVAMREGEVEALLGDHFDIELYDQMEEEPAYALIWKVYIMKRKS